MRTANGDIVSRRNSRARNITAPSLSAFRTALMRWSKRHRRPFFWRSSAMSSHALLITEILLSRTQAAVAETIAKQVIDRYPTPASLAVANSAALRSLLRPLGLQNKRATMLQACAAQVVEQFGGEVPRDPRQLARLPYVGPYAIDAMSCFAFGERVPVVDINVARLYHRVFALPEPHKRRRHPASLREFAARALPRTHVAEFNWALLDLGGMICTARRPRCAECPAIAICRAHAEGWCGCVAGGIVKKHEERR